MMLFLDGVGIGKRDPIVNPLFAAKLPALRWLLANELPSLGKRVLSNHRATLVPLDATLGVDGLPQSGTGQTALFTGVNASKLIGKHFGPYPYSTLRPVIHERNIFRQLIDADKRPYFANAFPQRFFDYMSKRPSRLTVTTLSCVMTGLPLLKAEDLLAGRGISADITNHGWKELGYPDVLPIGPTEAGYRLALLSTEYDFVLFEFWKTDHAGHSRSMSLATHTLELFDAMLGGIIEKLDARTTILVITSDHGNIEDMSTKVHTRHPVPAIIYGRGHAEIAHFLQRPRKSSPADLTCVTPILVKCITANGHR